MSKRVFIASAARTAIGSFNGSIAGVSAVDLGIAAVKGAIARANLSEKTDLIGETNLGCILQAGLGQGAARQVAIGAGIPNSAPAVTTNILCGSGLFSVIQGARSIVSGDNSVFVAGGMENMSASPYILPKGRNGF
ncbi:acetyl-CoA C-acyltransferase, partial [bacterium]|nr:acetyl-CoA C-acyltransferase [bacterium]